MCRAKYYCLNCQYIPSKCEVYMDGALELERSLLKCISLSGYQSAIRRNIGKSDCHTIGNYWDYA